MTSFSELRRERHRVWLAELKRQIHELLVATSKDDAELWVNLLLDRGLAQDVIGLDHDAWMQLPAHPSAIWRGVARDAQPLLAEPGS